jgi:hypothetical protein
MLRSKTSPYFKTSPHIANGDVDPGPPSVADQFAEIMFHICLDYDLEPDVLGAAQDVLQALKAKGKKRVEPDREATLPTVVSRAARPPWLFSESDL